MIGGMSRALAHLAGTISMLLTTLLWVGLLDAGRADRIADSFAGFRNEYRVVLAGLLALVLALVAAIHAARWWYVAVICSLGTLAAFTYALSR